MHQDLFTSWGCEFDAALSTDRTQLIFTPRRTREGRLVPHNLFHKPGGHERQYESLLTAFLSLNVDSRPDTWEIVATQLGPLFHMHPLHHAAVNGTVRESQDTWLEARHDLFRLWEGFQALASLSEDSLSTQARRQAALTALVTAGADVDALSSEDLEPLIEAHMPHDWQNQRTEMLHSLGHQLNRRFMPNAQPIAPLVNPNTLQLELVFPTGIQALFFMSVALAREDRRAFPTRCSRQSCTRVSFMRGMKQYCSKACQEAEKSARYRRGKVEAPDENA